MERGRTVLIGFHQSTSRRNMHLDAYFSLSFVESALVEGIVPYEQDHHYKFHCHGFYDAY
jgi:hypothetical protein